MMSLILLLLPTQSEPQKKETLPYDPTSAYRELHLEGWLIRLNKKLDEPTKTVLRDQVLKLVGIHLYQITREVPGLAVTRLKNIPIWIEENHPKHPCMCYHTSRDWLRANGMNPEKAGGVELANCKNFLSWTHQQPWMVFHELAHGYHDQVLGFNHPGVDACFQEAKKAKLYDSILRNSGLKVRHYALTNNREYFAEMSEAYFGTNDFYPFINAELREVDPRMHKLLGELWGMSK